MFIEHILLFAEINPKLLALLTHIKEQNDVIIALLESKATTNTTTLPSDFPVELPVTNEENLNIVEEYINKQQNFSYLVSYWNANVIDKTMHNIYVVLLCL